MVNEGRCLAVPGTRAALAIATPLDKLCRLPIRSLSLLRQMLAPKISASIGTTINGFIPYEFYSPPIPEGNYQFTKISLYSMGNQATLAAEAFESHILAMANESSRLKMLRYFPDQSEADYSIGVPMGELFKLGKEHLDMPVGEIEKLLESSIHEVRVGAVSIMDQCGRRKKTSEDRRKELYDLFTRRSDRINTWDLVDLGAQYVVGRYLVDKPRDALYAMARSDDPWKMRTAIVSTLYFRYQKDLEDMLALAEIMVHDHRPYVEKAVGWALRVAGDIDKDRLIQFLDRFATTMPRTSLRNAIEHFDPAERKHYLGLAKVSPTK